MPPSAASLQVVAGPAGWHWEVLTGWSTGPMHRSTSVHFKIKNSGGNEMQIELGQNDTVRNSDCNYSLRYYNMIHNLSGNAIFYIIIFTKKYYSVILTEVYNKQTNTFSGEHNL